jgi:hypothetical protein
MEIDTRREGQRERARVYVCVSERVRLRERVTVSMKSNRIHENCQLEVSFSVYFILEVNVE